MKAILNLKDRFLGRLIPYRGSTYKKIGGKKVIEKLVDDFYFVMANDPKASRCLATHQGRSLIHSGEKLKAFLSGWTGGPQDYQKLYGHPRLRMRHFPFSIGEVEAEEWLYCMDEALKKSQIHPEHQAEMMRAFKGLTDLIKNRS